MEFRPFAVGQFLRPGGEAGSDMAMDLTLKQMRILTAVVTAGSMTRASRIVGLSQPTISQQLAKMEKTLGVKLIIRHRDNDLVLSPAGDFWYRASRETLDRLDVFESRHAQTYARDNISIRFGATPSLRSRFLRAAARIVVEDPSFSSFEFVWAPNSTELLELLAAHSINCAVVSEHSVEPFRSILSVQPIFQDRIVWVVPESVSDAAIADALRLREDYQPGHEALCRIAGIGAVAPWESVSHNWYRSHMPCARQFFTCMTHQAAVDLVAEGLATCHAPLSLVPNLPRSVRNAIRFYDISGIERTAVLAMPKHLLTLKPYSDFRRRLMEFAAAEYSPEMPFHDLSELPISLARPDQGDVQPAP